MLEPARIPLRSTCGMLGDPLDDGTDSPGVSIQIPSQPSPLRPARRTAASGTPADNQGYPRYGRRADYRISQREELTVEVDRARRGTARAGYPATPDHTAPDRARIDTTDLEFVPVVPADTDPERQPAGRQFSDAGELPRHEHWVP